MATCARCGEESIATTMSYFNTEVICPQCKDEERQAPGYEVAVSTEMTQIKVGEYNFKGVGLSAEDRAFLARLRQERKSRAR
jgi:hypothetical protein